MNENRGAKRQRMVPSIFFGWKRLVHKSAIPSDESEEISINMSRRVYLRKSFQGLVSMQQFPLNHREHCNGSEKQ